MFEAVLLSSIYFIAIIQEPNKSHRCDTRTVIQVIAIAICEKIAVARLSTVALYNRGENSFQTDIR